MLYRLYIYKSSAATGTAPAVYDVNAAVSTNDRKQWEDEAAHYMEHFDAAAVKAQIEKTLGDKCKVIVCFPPKKYEQKEYLFIATSYERACEVLPQVHAIAMENRLALYDAETGRSFFKSLFDDTFITMKIREQELKNCILKEMTPVWKIRKISSYQNERDKCVDYVVSLIKASGKTVSDRADDFYACLKSHLRDTEKLACENRAFIITGEWYTITFVLEAYKKHANMVGYYENGHAKHDLTRRMSVEEAYKWMVGCSDTERRDIQKRMLFREMEDKFPNPADRLVNSVRITKWQRKQVFKVRYSGFGYYGSEILFHIVPDPFYEETYQESQNISVLKIEEESASFILPFINDFYPHFYQRYYLTANHLPAEMWRAVVAKIKEAQDLILNDTYSLKLAKYIDQFNLFVLANDRVPKFWESGDGYKIRNNPVDFVFEHRYEIAYLYEIFIQWSETQLYYYDYSGDERMFNIQGP